MMKAKQICRIQLHAVEARIAMWQVALLHLLIQKRITAVRLLLLILNCHWHCARDRAAQSVRSQRLLSCLISLAAIGNSTNRGSRRRRRKRSGSGGVETTGDDDVAASYARFSSTMQSEEGNAHQLAKNREEAARNGHCIPPDLEFSDEAVSGTKRDRAGLNAMLVAAEAGRFRTLYLYSLSRLARESVISLPMLKRLVYRYDVRVISLVDGLDSDRDGWELIAHVISIVNEQFLRELRACVLRGQEGALLAGFSVGDYRFGYKSVPVPGSEVNRRGRRPKPRMIYVIDEETAPWVLRIFNWFVLERRNITWIVRELNRLKAPKDHRSSTPDWRHELVVGVLESEKYIGVWPWGENTNVRDPETGKIRQVPRDEEECEQWTRQLPHLRLIDDETFETAQRLLEEHDKNRATLHDSNGKFRGSRAGASHPRHLLSGIIVCGECGSTFYVGGTNGKYLFCPKYKRGLCRCQTQLRRDRGERMILDEIGRRILTSPAWLKTVGEEMLKAWRRQEEQVPQELATDERSLSEVQRKIDRLVDRVENGVDDRDVKKRLQERRAEKRRLVKEIDRLRRVNENRGPEPSMDWVRDQLNELSDAVNGDTPAAALALRELVGGRIVVTEIRRDGRQRHYLQGRFTIRSTAVATAVIGKNGEDNDTADDEHTEEIVIDFVDPDPMIPQSEEAKKLYDQGYMNVEIAKILGWSKSQVTKILKFWFESRGLTMPDGRARRSTLPQKQSVVPQYQRIVEEAKRLWDANFAVVEIARRLDCCDMTVWKAIAEWHRVRGLPIPTAKDRRQRLMQRGRQLYEEGCQIKDIAAELGYSPRGMKLLIEQSYKAEGREMPDGRSRRHQPKD